MNPLTCPQKTRTVPPGPYGEAETWPSHEVQWKALTRPSKAVAGTPISGEQPEQKSLLLIKSWAETQQKLDSWAPMGVNPIPGCAKQMLHKRAPR